MCIIVFSGLIQAHKAIKDTCMSSTGGTGGTVSLTSVNMASTGTMRRFHYQKLQQ